MANIFSSISLRKPKKNMFDLSHESKLSCQFGDLIPVLVQEVIPGDKFKVEVEMMARLAPLIAPIMAHVNIFIHFFYVPSRIVFTDFKKFITGGKLGTDTTVMPTLLINNAHKAQFLSGSLADYMGIPPIPGATTPQRDLRVNALPFRAYQLIYNEYYRDQTLDIDLFDFDGEGDISLDQTVTEGEQEALTTMRTRCWEKDYFTSALPWAQRGGDVELPVEATVTFVPEYAPISKFLKASDGQPIGSDNTVDQQGSAQGNMRSNSIEGRVVNLAGSTDYDVEGSNVTINDLRRSIKLQEWLEKNARSGSRYNESLLAHFGVVSSDASLQRPQFLGGGSAPMVISEVLSTVETATVPQGNMAGHGVAVGGVAGFKKFFEEHGYILGIMSILPRTSYCQGLDRMWSKLDKLDFAWPEFAQLGEQEIMDNELYHNYNSEVAPALWGYTSRYAEYKFRQGNVKGDFRNTLTQWHMCRIFNSAPGLNSTFVHMDDAEISRVFNVTDQSVDHVYMSMFFKIKAIRPLPVYGTPSI